MCPVLFHFPVWLPLVAIGVTVGLWFAERLKLAGWKLVASCVAGAMAGVAVGYQKGWLQQWLPVQGYGTLMLGGFLLGAWMARRRSLLLGIAPRHCIDLGLWSVLGGLIGARIFHVVVYWPDYDPSGPAGSQGLYRIVALWEGGLIFFGALIAGPLSAMLYCLWHRLPVLAFVDLVIPGFIAGQALGRLGCLMRGCCFGRLTDGPLALSFPPESEVFIHQELHQLIPGTATHSLAVIPVQLYASIGAALTGAFLYAYWPRRRFDGEIIGWVFLMAAVPRFFEEFMRDEPAAFPAWSNSLTIAQWFAFVLVAAGVIWLWVFGRRGTLYQPAISSPQAQPVGSRMSLRDWARQIKDCCATVSLALRHQRTPWYAKACGAVTLLYALSPIDLIPDFIPVLGYLDDLILVPAGLWLTIKLIPADVWAECQQEVKRRALERPPKNWRGSLLIIFLWMLLAAAGVMVVRWAW